MNRKEITESRAYQISKAALEHASHSKNVVEAFEAGAEWADKHQNAVSMDFKHELGYFLYILNDDSLTYQDKVEVLRDKIKERLKNM